MASVGPQSPTVSQVILILGNNWGSPNNGFASDDTRTEADLDSSLSNTKEVLYTGFDFSSIPGGSTITGIVVEIERSCTNTSGNPHDRKVQLQKTSSAVGSNKASGTTWPTTDAYATYGTGTTDLWGTTWTLAEIQASTFGVYISAEGSSGSKFSTRVRIDHVRITVYYTAGGGGGTVIPVFMNQYRQRWA